MRNDEDFLTVDKLFELLEKLKQMGYGDMRIKCGDTFLHDDEVSISYYPEEVRFRGSLFHQPIRNKLFTLQEDIETAISKFYETREFRE